MGEIQGILFSLVIITFFCFVLVTGLNKMADNYGIETEGASDELTEVMESSFNSTSDWVTDAQGNITENAPAEQQIIWITTGGLGVIQSIFALPGIITNIAEVFVNALPVALGEVEPDGSLSNMTGQFIVVFGILVLIVFFFAAAKAIFKVDL